MQVGESDMISIPDIIVAVENKDHFVLDPFLKKGQFLKTRNGQLKRYVGGFTAVFPVVVNQEKWAFRCWHAEIGNVRKRFMIIADAINKSKAKYLCDFAYTDEGLLIKGMKYPTTRMRWVEGQTIKEYICNNASDATKLRSLAAKFLLLAQDMHKHSFAHGDLQHGNIMVDKQGELFLVDYDSFYCPELKGESDIIVGLADYQHPSRKHNLIANEKLDYFSELIIYLSILAIAENPSLANKYKVADSDRMLFSAQDYKDIKHSAIYNDLQLLSLDIQQLLDVLCIYLSKQSLSDLEPFDKVLDRLTKEPEIHTFDCDKPLCLDGDTITLNWSVENYTQVLLNGEDVTNLSSKEITSDLRTTNYKLEVFNYQKRTSQTLKLQIHPRPIISFTTNKDKLHKDKGEKVKLNWDVKNAESCELLCGSDILTNAEIKRNNTIGSFAVKPNETTTYTLRVTAQDQKTIIETHIIINVLNDAIVEFKTDKEYVFPSIPFSLSWQVQHANKVQLNGKDVKHTDTITYTNGVDKNTTYRLQVTDEFGTIEYPISIKMLPIPQIKALLVPTPHINETINVSTNVPTPTVSINFPQPELQQVELPSHLKATVELPNVQVLEPNVVSEPNFVKPNFRLPATNLWQRIVNNITNRIKH